MAEEELRLSRRGTEEHEAAPAAGTEATVDEGIRLLEAFRAISSAEMRAKILALVTTEAQRSTDRPPH